MAIFIGIIIGAILGLTGSGGSLFAVPLLMLFLGLPLADATGVALGAVAVTAAFGVIQRDKSEIVWLPALFILVFGVLFAPVGRWLTLFIDETVILSTFSVLVLWDAYKMWSQAKQEPNVAQAIRAELKHELETFDAGAPERRSYRSYVTASLAGVLVGVTSGVLGVGGGFIIVPMLSLVAGIPMRRAVASSLLVISMVSASGFASYFYFNGAVDNVLLGYVSIGGVVGMLIGSRMVNLIDPIRLQQVFAVLLLLVVARLWF